MASLRRAQTVVRARGSNKCSNHLGKDVIFVCVDCDGKLTCTTCVTTTHKNHSLKEISDVILQVKVTIQDFVNKTENTYIPEVKRKIESLDSEINGNKKHFRDVIGRIHIQNESIKQELDKITNKLIKLCREIEDQNNDLLRNHKAELQSRIEEMNARIEELKDTLQTGTDIQVYDVSREIPNDVEIPTLPSMQDAAFNPTSILIDELENLLEQISTPTGDNRIQVKSFVFPDQQHENVVTGIDKVNTTSDAGDKKAATSTTTKKSQASNKLSKGKVHSFKFCKTFTLEGNIYRIRSASDNQVWVNTGGGVLQLLDNTGQTQKTMKMEVDIKDFCVWPLTGDIWFCSYSDKGVRKLIRDDKSTGMFSTDIEPVSICISADGNILMGMARQLVKYTQRGKILCKSTQVKQVPDVKYPYRISQCPVTSNIAVVDWDSKDCGGDGKEHVSILSEDLQLLCRYYGRNLNSFSPCDVCYSDTGDIYIADYKTRSIQQISGRGKFIQTVYTDSDKLAYYLCVQSNGDIWAVFGVTFIKILQKQ